MSSRSSVIPPHTWERLITLCIASGRTANAFGIENGLTTDQRRRLSQKVRARTGVEPHGNSNAAHTLRTTERGSIIPENAALTLSRLSNQMVNAMLSTGKRAVEQLETFNSRYAPRKNEAGAMEVPDVAAGDLRTWRWAFQVCGSILTLSRRDGRDAAPAVDPGTAPLQAEPLQRALDGAPPGMLTVLRADGAEVLSVDPSSVQPAELPSEEMGESQQADGVTD